MWTALVHDAPGSLKELRILQPSRLGVAQLLLECSEPSNRPRAPLRVTVVASEHYASSNLWWDSLAATHALAEPGAGAAAAPAAAFQPPIISFQRVPNHAFE